MNEKEKVRSSSGALKSGTRCLITPTKKKRLGCAPGAEYPGRITCPSPSALNNPRLSDFSDCDCIGGDTEGEEVKLYWMKSSEAWPGGNWLEGDLSCFDGERPGRASDSLWDTHIGTVQRLEGDPGGGLWQWNVRPRFAGPRFPGVTSGREISQKDAVRCVVECYERMLRLYGKI